MWAISHKQSQQGFSIEETAKLIGYPKKKIQHLIDLQIINPRACPDGRYLFEFQHIVMLRAAKELLSAGISIRRLKNSITRLRQGLCDSTSLSSIRLSAEGKRVIAQQGGERWNPETDQLILNFSAKPTSGSARSVVLTGTGTENNPESQADYWFEQGCSMELMNPSGAITAYEKALEIDPNHIDSRLNLGRLHHERGNLLSADEAYKMVLKLSPGNATAQYNQAVLLEDFERVEEAVFAYKSAIRLAPTFAEAHYNLARLLEQLGRSSEAVQHLKEYRKLNGRENI